MAELKNPIKEAERYLDNAKQILSEKAEKDGNYYNDRKYVKMAGNTAWCGVLVALDAVTDVRTNLKKGQSLDLKDYQNAVLKKDKKYYQCFMSSYDILHKAMGYDGTLNYKVVQSGMEEAKTMVSWAAKHYKPQTV
ncbi:MAG: DUF5618 family protein [Paludibacter sp.]|nr:DUF5618 family protein [Paludibacter sp.]